MRDQRTLVGRNPSKRMKIATGPICFGPVATDVYFGRLPSKTIPHFRQNVSDVSVMSGCMPSALSCSIVTIICRIAAPFIPPGARASINSATGTLPTGEAEIALRLIRPCLRNGRHQLIHGWNIAGIAYSLLFFYLLPFTRLGT